MVLLDGKKLSKKILDDIRTEVLKLKKTIRLAVVVVGKDPVIAKFIEQKKKTAQSVGVEVRIYPFEEKITTNELRKQISKIVHEEKNSGVIIQLPLPEHLNTQYILNSVVPEKDVDMLSAKSLGNFIVGKNITLPPVAGAVQKFFDEYSISTKSRRIVVVGAGNLVGRPVALWLLSLGATFAVITQETPDPISILKGADIIISGAGSPSFIKGLMVKEDVVVIDAGTSESGGKLVGDVEFDSVSKKASFITPVPGGIGPVTVAMLLNNLVTLAKNG